MSLIIEASRPVFDSSEIKKGYLVYAMHRSWNEERCGIVTRVTEDKVTVQFTPGIGNVMNHFTIPATEVSGGQWTIRWSEDLTEIGSISMDDGSGDGDGQEDGE